VEIRPADRLADMVLLQKLASRLWPAGGHHPGGLGWALAIDEGPDDLHVALEGDEPLGWAGRTGTVAEVHVAAGHPEAAAALWTAIQPGPAGQPVSLLVFDGDDVVRHLAESSGLTPDLVQASVSGPPVYGMFHDAILDPPPAPARYRIRGLEPGEEAARVEAHRAAWRPATLPLPADALESVPAEATSKFTPEKFRHVQRAWLYDPDLDLVVEAADGTLAGCCTLWWDPDLGVAEIEPLGVLPTHRRHGLATALCLTAAGLIADRGGKQVFINVGPYEDYPAPAQTYTSAGFRTVLRATTWARQ
jgi:GNAT superfamily N-acetyltransferase